MLAFIRVDLELFFNWNTTRSFTGYAFLAPAGEYEVVINSDDPQFGGFGLVDDKIHHFTMPDPLYSPSGKGWLQMYLPARTAQVLRRVKKAPAKSAAASKAKKSAKTAATSKSTASKTTAKKK